VPPAVPSGHPLPDDVYVLRIRHSASRLSATAHSGAPDYRSAIIARGIINYGGDCASARSLGAAFRSRTSRSSARW
jgi:hypothetical protein